MQMVNRNGNINNNCHMMDSNTYSMNNHYNASTKFGTWRRRQIDGRKWRNEDEYYGNISANGGGDGSRFGKVRKNTQFRNRNEKKVNRFNNGGGVRFQPYVAARKARVMASPTEKDAVAVADDVNLSTLWGEVEKEWGLDMYGTMRGLIRLRSNGVDSDEGGLISGGSDEDAELVQFERRLSKYEIIYPKSVSGEGAGGNLKSGIKGRSLLLENENVMMKQSLSVMDRGMDDLKQRMDVLEMHLRAKINKEMKENGHSVAGERLGMVSLSVCA